MTKCLIFECQNEAKGNFPCCSESHGTTLRMRVNNIKDAFNGDTLVDRSMYTIREVEHYMSL